MKIAVKCLSFLVSRMTASPCRKGGRWLIPSHDVTAQTAHHTRLTFCRTHNHTESDTRISRISGTIVDMGEERFCVSLAIPWSRIRASMGNFFLARRNRARGAVRSWVRSGPNLDTVDSVCGRDLLGRIRGVFLGGKRV